MAGLLDPAEAARREAVLVGTIRRWSSEPCAPHPCGEEVWRYACALAAAEMSLLPNHREDAAMVALLRREGGLANYAGKLVEGIGWQRLSGDAVPVRGDVGVVSFPGQPMLTCAVFLDPCWMTKGDGFLRADRALFSRVWRLPCPRL